MGDPTLVGCYVSKKNGVIGRRRILSSRRVPEKWETNCYYMFVYMYIYILVYVFLFGAFGGALW